MDNELLLNSILPGDLVLVLTRQGPAVSGRAVVRGLHGWILNRLGANGAPLVATAYNILTVSPQIKPRRRRDYGHTGGGQ